MSHEYFKVGTTQALINAVKARTADKPDGTAYAPDLTAGAALGITGDGPTETAAWLQRTSTSDGPTTVKSIHGRTVRWNQLVGTMTAGTTTHGVTAARNGDGSATLSGTGDAAATVSIAVNIGIIANHKYLIKGGLAGGSLSTYYLNVSGLGRDYGSGDIFTHPNSITGTLRYTFAEGVTFDNAIIWPQLFDLTAMFGAGSEPSTVAEFEALYPLPYYPYDAGSLLPVNMTGIETVGANLWGGDAFKADFLDLASSVTEGTNEYGRYIDLPASAGSGSPAVFTGPFKPNTRYTIYFRIGRSVTATSTNLKVTYTDGTTSNIARYATTSDGSPEVLVFVTNASKSLAAVNAMINSGHSYLYYDQCGLFEGVHGADEFKPYWQQQRTIDVSTYYPQGMNGVGGFYDELTETKAITRMHTVTLDGTQDNVHYLLNTSREVTTASISGHAWTEAGYPEPMHGYSTVKLLCNALPTLTSDYKTWPDGTKGIAVWSDNSAAFVIAPTGDKTITTEDQFKAWLAQNPLTITYAVATPTVTPIDQPLNLTYRTEQGGTERVMVPTGEQSAPPTLVTAQGYTAESLRDVALSAIAPVENGTASTNYAVGAYLVHGGQLCRVTTAIATGESISIGTNVTTTTVMAEVLSLTQ